MVREIKKVLKGEKGLEELEKETNKQVSEIEEQRKKAFDDAEMDTGFFFSVVFNTFNEREEWLKKHNIKLEEGFFVKAKNFLI